MERPPQAYLFNRRSSKINWLKKAPRKEPMRLKHLCNGQLIRSIINAVNYKENEIGKDFRVMCEMIKTTLPIELRSFLAQEVSASQEVKNHSVFTKIFLMHFLTDVQHIFITTELAAGTTIDLTQEQCDRLLEALGSVSKFSLLSIHVEGVTFAKGVLSEIIHRSPNLASIHISGDEAASDVLSFIAKYPRGLHALHLDTCNVNDQDVVQALVKSYYETDSWTVTGIPEVHNTDIDGEFPPLCHLSIQSPSVTVCGTLVLLHSLRNLKTLQYSYWNSSICNLLQYLQQQQSPKDATFALTSMALWRVSEKSLETIKLCPNMQHLMMECTDPSLVSMDALKELPKLNSLTLRLIPEELVLSTVQAVGDKLLYLGLEYEEYAKTPIKWSTILSIQKHCPYLRRLELHHINVTSNSEDMISFRSTPSFVDLTQLNLSNVELSATLLNRILFKNEGLESLVLNVNQEAVTHAVVMSMVRNNDLSLLSEVYISSGMLSTRTITVLMALPSMLKISIQLSKFPLITPANFLYLEDKIAGGNYQCSLDNDEIDE